MLNSITQMAYYTSEKISPLLRQRAFCLFLILTKLNMSNLILIRQIELVFRFIYCFTLFLSL